MGAMCLGLEWLGHICDGLEDSEYTRQKDFKFEQAQKDFAIWKLHIQKADKEYDERVLREKHARRVAKEQERAMKKERKKQGRRA